MSGAYTRRQMSTLRGVVGRSLFCLVMAACTPAWADSNVTHQELIAQAKSAYDAGQFLEAVALLERAYGISGEPNLLWNMARSYEKMSDSTRAAETYRRYINVVKEQAEKDEAYARISALVEESPPRENSTAPAGSSSVTLAQSQADAPMGQLGVAGVSTLVSGLALTAVGGVLLGVGGADAEEVEDARKNNSGVVVGITRSQALDLEESAGWKQATGLSGVIVGSLAVVVGGLMWMADGPDPQSPPLVSSWWSTEGGGVLLQQRF